MGGLRSEWQMRQDAEKARRDMNTVQPGAQGVLKSQRQAYSAELGRQQEERIAKAEIEANNRNQAAQRSQEMRINNTNLGNPDGKFVTQGQYDSNPDFWRNGGYSVPQIGKPASGSGQSPTPSYLTGPETTRGLTTAYKGFGPTTKNKDGTTTIFDNSSGGGRSYSDSVYKDSGANAYTPGSAMMQTGIWR